MKPYQEYTNTMGTEVPAEFLLHARSARYGSPSSVSFMELLLRSSEKRSLVGLQSASMNAEPYTQCRLAPLCLSQQGSGSCKFRQYWRH